MLAAYRTKEPRNKASEIKENDLPLFRHGQHLNCRLETDVSVPRSSFHPAEAVLEKGVHVLRLKDILLSGNRNVKYSVVVDCLCRCRAERWCVCMVNMIYHSFSIHDITTWALCDVGEGGKGTC